MKKRVEIYGGLSGKLALEYSLKVARLEYEKVCKEIWDEVEQEMQNWIKDHPQDIIQLDSLMKSKEEFYNK